MFSSIGAMEGINAIVTGDLVSLSDQELVSSHRTKVGDYAFEWVISNDGIHSEADYPCINSTDGPYNTTKVGFVKIYFILSLIKFLTVSSFVFGVYLIRRKPRLLPLMAIKIVIKQTAPSCVLLSTNLLAWASMSLLLTFNFRHL